ncbi:MAG: hypothetical protein EHM80_02035 [Nitrospiraceae bacterium]|nr:MAG: hypothetical protein EHM80_02035 [Nitrospiraceae bacterium]
MKPTVWSLPGVLILSILIVGLTACTFFERKESETSVTKQILPAQPPMVSKLELVQSSEGARLTPKGDTIPGAAKVQKSAVDEIRENSPVVQAAERHPQVQEKLGHRYFFISAEPAKSKERFCPSSLLRSSGQAVTIPALTRLTYYSYSNTAAVIVCMNEQEFVSLPVVPKDYQPPESDREEEEAIRVARLDPRIQDKVKDLQARVILTDPEWRLWWWNQEGYGHRVFYVTFERDGSGAPQYWAVVDLAQEADQDKVRQAGAEPTR